MAENPTERNNLDQTSAPFRQYHEMVKEVTGLKAKKEETKAQLEKLQQLLTLATMINEQTQVDVLKESILYCERLLSEVVS